MNGRAILADAGLAVPDELPDTLLGFVIHVTPCDVTGTLPFDSPGDDGWFVHDTNARPLAAVPVGITSDVGPRANVAAERADSDSALDVLGAWRGEPLRALDGEPLKLATTEAYRFYVMAALAAGKPLAWEIWVESRTPWAERPDTCEHFVAWHKKKALFALGVARAKQGFERWQAASSAADSLTNIPEGAEISIGTADAEAPASSVGRMAVKGVMKNRKWTVSATSPRLPGAALWAALRFIEDLVVRQRVGFGNESERADVLEAAAQCGLATAALVVESDHAQFASADEPTLFRWAGAVFRQRFAAQFPADLLAT